MAANDRHVPADGAQRFQAALRQSAPLTAERMRINLVPDTDHLDASRQPFLWQNCLDWFTQLELPQDVS